jgi:hypothetical protein
MLLIFFRLIDVDIQDFCQFSYILTRTRTLSGWKSGCGWPEANWCNAGMFVCGYSTVQTWPALQRYCILLFIIVTLLFNPWYAGNDKGYSTCNIPVYLPLPPYLFSPYLWGKNVLIVADIGAAIEKLAGKSGLRVVPAFTGHGIGRYFHGPPDIYHCRYSKIYRYITIIIMSIPLLVL